MDRDDQVRLRQAAAGLIKGLIRARCRQEPDFLPGDDLRRWGVSDVRAEDRSCAQLLNRVRQLRGRFERDFLQGQDSIPAPSSAADAEVMDAVIDQVASFLYGDLDEAVRLATRDRLVRWEELANWNRLAALRDALDRLPEGDTASGRRASEESTLRTQEDEDGPVAPDGFVYGGQPYNIPAGLVFRLLDALWRAPKWTLRYEDLAGLVWDHAAEVTKGKVGSVRTRTNDAFKQNDLPFRILTRDGYVRLVPE